MAERGALRLVLSPAATARTLSCRRPACSAPLPVPTGTAGRPASYCSPTCRKLAHEERKAAEVALRHAQRVLEQYVPDLACQNQPAEPDVVDSAGALILHARRAVSELEQSPRESARHRAMELQRALERLEAMLSAAT